MEIFSYIHNLLSMPGYSPEEKQAVRDKVLHHIQVSKYTDRHIYTTGFPLVSGAGPDGAMVVLGILRYLQAGWDL